MLIASMMKDGRRVLVLGLEEENVRRLRNDEPIYKDLRGTEVEGLEDWDVTILGPEDTARFIAYATGGGE